MKYLIVIILVGFQLIACLGCSSLDIIDASWYGDIDRVKSIAKFDRSTIKYVDEDGKTALHQAAYAGHLEIVRFLIANGADVNAANNDGEVPLHSAAYQNQVEVAKILLSNAASLDPVDKSGETPLHLSAQKGNLNFTKYLISQGANVNKKNNELESPIFNAVSSDNNTSKELVEHLISKGAEVNSRNINGETPLFEAAFKTKLEISKLLESNGAHLKVRNNSGETLLHRATSSFFLIVTKVDIVYLEYLLAKGLDINAQDNEGKTPLHYAISKNRTEMVEFFVSHGANVEIKDNFGEKPIDIAIRRDNTKYQEILSSQKLNDSLPNSVSYKTLHSADSDIKNGQKKFIPQQKAPTIPFSLPNRIRSNSNAIAVIIGNKNYFHKDIPSVNFASNDATAVKRYVIETLGYKDGNIIFETDTTKAKLEMIFGIKEDHRGMLFNYIKPDKSEVFIYYSGHGAPDPQTNRAYLVPTDGNPVMMSLTGYPLDVLYGNLPKIEAKSVTVVLDACFSGGTNTGKWLVQNASPALIKVNNPVTGHNNITIFTSAKNNQVSSWYPEKQHSMFTYFFLTAVTGSADFNQDRQITYQEIYNFVADRAEGVPYYAKRLHGGRIQNPTMHTANKDAVFVKY